ncbi:MAG TPA: DUF2141 domain-containing protein [Saprospiraceae bacterium]|nr:DUF2141 domain-containing protein [Saprospiraceae bacterium]
MKHLLTTIAIFVGIISYAQTNTLTVTLTNFKNNQGKVMVGIYSGANTFMKKTIYSKVGEIKANTAKVVFENIPDGEYAISLYHDENSNNKLDKGWFSIPKEGYGCSNDAKGNMGPPKYEDAKFQLTNHKNMTIKINN